MGGLEKEGLWGRGRAWHERIGNGKHSRSPWDRPTPSHTHIHTVLRQPLYRSKSHTEIDTVKQGHTDGHSWGRGAGSPPSLHLCLSVSLSLGLNEVSHHAVKIQK